MLQPREGVGFMETNAVFCATCVGDCKGPAATRDAIGGAQIAPVMLNSVASEVATQPPEDVVKSAETDSEVEATEVGATEGDGTSTPMIPAEMVYVLDNNEKAKVTDDADAQEQASGDSVS